MQRAALSENSQLRITRVGDLIAGDTWRSEIQGEVSFLLEVGRTVMNAYNQSARFRAFALEIAIFAVHLMGTLPVPRYIRKL